IAGGATSTSNARAQHLFSITASLVPRATIWSAQRRTSGTASALAERRELLERRDLALDRAALGGEEGGDGAPEAGVGDMMGRPGRHRPVAAGELVGALRAGLDP